MRQSTILLLCAVVLLGAIATVRHVPVQAQSPEQTYTLNWWTVDGGGATQPGGTGYTLGGTAGQPDPGVLTGGSYTLGGGFWRGGVPSAGPQYTIYLPLVAR